MPCSGAHKRPSQIADHNYCIRPFVASLVCLRSLRTWRKEGRQYRSQVGYQDVRYLTRQERPEDRRKQRHTPSRRTDRTSASRCLLLVWCGHSSVRVAYQSNREILCISGSMKDGLPPARRIFGKIRIWTRLISGGPAISHRPSGLLSLVCQSTSVDPPSARSANNVSIV